MESRALERRMFREATVGLVVLLVLLGVLSLTIYSKTRALFAVDREELLTTPVNVFEVERDGRVVPLKRRQTLVSLPNVETNQLVDLDEIRPVSPAQFAERLDPASVAYQQWAADAQEEPVRVARDDMDGRSSSVAVDRGMGDTASLPAERSTSPNPALPLNLPSGTNPVGELPDRDTPTGLGAPVGGSESREIQVIPDRLPDSLPNHLSPTAPNRSSSPARSLPRELPTLPTQLPMAGLPTESSPSESSQPGSLSSGLLPTNRLPPANLPADRSPADRTLADRTPSENGLLGSSPTPRQAVLEIDSVPSEDADDRSEEVARSATPLPLGTHDTASRPIPAHLPSADLAPLEPDPTVAEEAERMAAGPRPSPRRLPDTLPDTLPESLPQALSQQPSPSASPSLDSAIKLATAENAQPQRTGQPLERVRGHGEHGENPVDYQLGDLKAAMRHVGLPAGWSLSQLSEHLYGDSRYALALLQLNHRRASSQGQFIPGTQIMYLPPEMLEFVYPDLIPEADSAADVQMVDHQEEIDRPPLLGSDADMAAGDSVIGQNQTRSANAPAIPRAVGDRDGWYVTRGGESLFEIAAEHLDQASHYIWLMQWNRVVVSGSYGPTDPLPQGLRLRVAPPPAPR